MARLKAEFLYQYYRERGLPWRNRVFGHIAALARTGSALAPVSNWIMRNSLSGSLNEKLLKIDRRRILPEFARHSLTKRFSVAVGYRSSQQSARRVLLFPDTFTNYFQPEIGEATIDLLRRCGCEVTLGPSDLRCCGRPMISNGLLDRAVANARHNVERLHEWTRNGGSIVACEPSCILTIKDDYPALLRGESRCQAEIVAKACLTVEEILEPMLGSDPGSRLHGKPGPRRIVVQAHCHQRSLVGSGPLVRLLRLVPGSEVVDLDSGCCGMAGSFGYEMEHYEISKLVAQQRLLPALRQAGPDAVIVASGFSCRLQIEHFTGRQAFHPASLLRSSLC
jgi:Fe-S oxidoreductase